MEMINYQKEKIKKTCRQTKANESKLSAQQIADMTIDLDKLNSADFQSKYKMTKEQFAKITGVKQK